MTGVRLDASEKDIEGFLKDVYGEALNMARVVYDVNTLGKTIRERRKLINKVNELNKKKVRHPELKLKDTSSVVLRELARPDFAFRGDTPAG